MVKRICPQCFTRWYSADNTDDIWKCSSCGADITRDKATDELEDANENKSFG
jgi:ribosomal protein L37AE/L43A